MKERPILFSDEMVRAILDGRKTQTRRPVKLPPVPSAGHLPWELVSINKHPARFVANGATALNDPHAVDVACRYGVPGDRLWVREAWAPYHGVDDPVDVVDDATAARYRADDSVWTCEGSPDLPPCRLDSYALAPHHEMPGGPHRWRPSIHMPRWASRITLEVTDVRVQRLQDISEEDAQAEGLLSARAFSPFGDFTARAAFASLWERINGEGSWAANPWVWALTFERVQP